MLSFLRSLSYVHSGELLIGTQKYGVGSISMLRSDDWGLAYVCAHCTRHLISRARESANLPGNNIVYSLNATAELSTHYVARTQPYASSIIMM